MQFLLWYAPDHVRVTVGDEVVEFIFHHAQPSRDYWRNIQRSTSADAPLIFHLIPLKVAAFQHDFLPSPAVIAVGFDGYLRTTRGTVSSEKYNGRRKQRIRHPACVANLAWDVRFGSDKKGKEKFADAFRKALQGSRYPKGSRSLEEEGILPENDGNRGSSEASQEQDEDFGSAVGDALSFDADPEPSDTYETVDIEEDRSTSLELERDGNKAGSMGVAHEVNVPQAIETGDGIDVDKPGIEEILAEDWGEYEEVISEGRKRKKKKVNPNERRTLNGVLYQLHTRCEWRDLPDSYGRWNTVYRQHKRWQERGIWGRMEDLLEKRGLIEASQRVTERSSQNPEEGPEAATSHPPSGLAAFFADGRFGDGDTSDGARKLFAFLAEALERHPVVEKPS
jgi:transposase